jgi:N-carbamoylputrescine amidase
MKIKIATSQFKSIKDDFNANINKALKIAENAANLGVEILLLQELFQYQYFCSTKNPKYFNLAIDFPNNNLFSIFSNFCKDKKIILPISFFEKKNDKYFNSLVVIDSDGSMSDIYRKAHIPEGPGYNEKFYFSKGKGEFMVFKTKKINIGCAICWDQWFPECSRILALKGAEIIFYPSAIGSEPHLPKLNSRKHWKNVMIGHAASNQVPIVASNRVGIEIENDIKINFYGNSLIINHIGEVLNEMDNKKEGFIEETLNIAESNDYRHSW